MIGANPRNRKTTKRGRKRLFNETIHALRMRVERTFAWEDKFKALVGFQGRGCTDGVQPDFCHSLFP